MMQFPLETISFFATIIAAGTAIRLGIQNAKIIYCLLVDFPTCKHADISTSVISLLVALKTSKETVEYHLCGTTPQE